MAVEGEGTPDELLERARAERAKAEAAEAERLATQERLRLEEERKFLALPRVRAADILPGDLLQYHDPRSMFNKYPTCRVGRREPMPSGLRLLPPGGSGFILQVGLEEVFALVERPEQTPEGWQEAREEGFHYCAVIEHNQLQAMAAVWRWSVASPEFSGSRHFQTPWILSPAKPGMPPTARWKLPSAFKGKCLR